MTHHRLIKIALAAALALPVAACNLEQEAKIWVKNNQVNGVIYIDDGYSEGGDPAKYANRIWQANKAGVRFEITTAVCKSACTLFLAADEVCSSPWTVYKFHSAKRGIESLGGLLPVGNDEGNQMLAEWYGIRSPQLARDFLSNAAHRVVMSDWWDVPAPKALRDYGVPICRAS